MMPQGIAEQQRAGAADSEVDRPLDDRVEPLQRNVVDVDDRNAVEIFEAGAQREELHQVRHDLHVDHLAARALDEVEHLHVLVERQRHVQVIDVLLPDDFGRVARACRAAADRDSRDDRRRRGRRRSRST